MRLLIGLIALLSLGAAGAAEDAAKPGAYCPLPEPGQRPVCLEPARATYADFFASVDEGRVDERELARIEADLGSSERAHLALSSLAYGYYRLAQSVGETPGAGAAVSTRLARWNDVLAEAYQQTPPQAPLRRAMREAAVDLHTKAARIEIDCPANDTLCSATGALVATLEAVDTAAGIRSPLSNLVRRLIGGADR